MRRAVPRKAKPNYPVKINRASRFAKNCQTFQIVTNSRCQNIVANNLDVLLRNGAKLKIDQIGRSIFCDGANDVIDNGTASRTVVDLSGGYSTMAVLVYNRGSDAGGTIMAKRDGTTVEFQLYNSGGNIAFRIDSSTGVSTVGFAESDGWCWIGAILNQDDANDVQVFKYSTKNKDLTIQTIGSTFPTPTRRDINLSLGARWASFPTTGFQGAFDIAAWGVWADNWDLTKLRSFIKDPWDIVQPRVGYVPKVIAAAPGGNDGAAMYHHFVRTGVYG